MKGEAFAPVPNRGMITLSIMLANIMQGLDNTILNVALPHIQGSLSASLDQIAWLLGYEGPTSFNAAFARWTGKSASEVRNETQQPDSLQQ